MAQTQSQRRLAAQVERLNSRLEMLEFERKRLEQRLVLDQIDRQKDALRIEEMYQSRIWRTLVAVGGLVLGLGRILPKRSVKKAVTLPAPIPYSPAPIGLLHSRRDAPKTVAQWAELISTAVSSLAEAKSLPPRISIITPTWNTKLVWFAEAALSILKQTCTDWEWCIVDNGSTVKEFQELIPALEKTGRIKFERLETNEGISRATNHGLELASGDYICCLDHDDQLSPVALAECLELLGEEFDAVYTDSDKVNEAGVRIEPFFKPDWSPEYFRGVMFVGHLLCVRRDVALEVGGFDPKYDGIQDFEFMLRFSERTQRIGHVSKVLYHWRTVPGSVAASSEAKGDLTSLQQEAVQAHLRRINLPAVAVAGSKPHRVGIVPLTIQENPRISIVIPTRDAPDVLEACLASIFQETKYSNFEVICVDNETADPRALAILKKHPIRHVEFPGTFNFSRANNEGVRHTSGSYLVFMNNDIEVITPNWAEEMLYYARQEDVGAVGGLLLYPDRSVQHAGVVLGCRGTADHVLRRAPGDSDGYAGSLSCAREVSAVTAACMMIARSDFERAGGFNEHYFTAYQDVDLCLELRSQSKRNIFAPRAVFLHRESYSRGRYYDFIDRNLLLDRWEEMIASDPYYNPNLDVEACDYSLKAG
ncbi:MAG: glycosyltransferase family 2 protein [Bryobacterales bacterium]|nr:glycosyltransferase family 2 protein [Bryobacterales bacterium]